MAEFQERRREKRLRYNWPVWFAENYDSVLAQGQMVDISSGGAAFTCYTDACPGGSDNITARFSVPRYGKNNSFDMDNYIRDGRICRIEEVSPYIRRIAVQFFEPLPFKPGEYDDTEALQVDETLETEQSLEAVTA